MALLLVQGALNALWISKDRRLPFWDQSRYYDMTVECGEALANPGPDTLHRITGAHPSHPPGFPLLATPFRALFGGDWAAARLALLPLGACLTLSVFWLGRRLFSDLAGLLAAAFVAGAPAMTGAQHLFQTEAALVPAVAAGWALLDRTEGFTRTRASVAFGAFSGAAILVKWTYPVFLGVPAVLALARSRRFRGVLPALAATLAITLPWFVSHARGLRDFAASGVAAGEGYLSAVGGSPFTLKAMLFYPREILVAGLGPPLFAFLLVGLAKLRRRRSIALDLGLGIAVPLVVFTLVPTKQLRHLLPVFPILALGAVHWIPRIRRPAPRRAAVAAALLLPLAAGLHASFRVFGDDLEVAIAGRRLPLLAAAREPGPPDPTLWPVAEAVRILAADLGAHGDPAEALVLFNLTGFRIDGFRHVAREAGVRIGFPDPPFWYPPEHPGHAHTGFDALLRPRWWLVKTGTSWVRFLSGVPVHRSADLLADRLLDPAGRVRGATTLLAALPLPDGSLLEVHRRPAALPPDALGELAAAALRLDADDPAASAFRSAGDLRPAAFARGLAALSAGDRGRAASDFREALRLLPEDEASFRRLADALDPVDMPAAAGARRMADHLVWRATHDQAASAALEAAAVHAEAGRSAGAIREARRALEASRDAAPLVSGLLRRTGIASPPVPITLEWLRAAEVRAATVDRRRRRRPRPRTAARSARRHGHARP